MTALLLVALALLVATIALYNRLVRDRNLVAAGWSDIDVQLQRRHDLVPNLVTAVQAYAGHESALFERVAAERTRARAQPGVGARGEAESTLGADLTALIALAEAYPALKADGQFAQLSRQLVEIEEHLQSARRFYNGAVRQFNDRQQRFPHLLLARVAGFHPAEFFQAGAEARAAPAVALG